MIEELKKSARELGERAERVLAGMGEDEAALKSISLLAELGMLEWTVPPANGGADPGPLLLDPTRVCVRVLCTLRAALAYHSGMLDVMLVMQGLGSHPLCLAGHPDLKQTVLPHVRTGRKIAAFALTEPGAGSSLGEIATRAERRGEHWRLNGHKTFISNAGVAGFYSVLARTSGAPGDGDPEALSMFFVPSEVRGLEVKRFEVMAPHPIGEVLFHDVELRSEYLIGEVGQGLMLATTTLERFRPTVAAAAVGFSRRALDESISYLTTRMQFGRPLGANQGLRFELAEMDTRLRAAQLLVAEAAEALDNEIPAVIKVARAKLFATETASWICDRAVQFHGGLGVKRGTVVERLFREVRALRIYEGTSEVQKLILAKELLREQEPR